MKITDVEGLVLRPGEVDATRADGTQDAFIVKIHTDEGITGVGEGDTSPYVAREMITMPASHSIARGFRELLIGEDPLRVRPLWAKMFAATYHYGRDGAALHVMSAIDMALWDILGKVAGLPGRPASRRPGGRPGRRVRQRGHAGDPRGGGRPRPGASWTRASPP